MKRIALVLFASLALVVGVATATAGNGNSDAANACKQGGWQNLVRQDGTGFKNQGDCVSYAAQGGVPTAKPPVVNNTPAPKATGDIWFTNPFDGDVSAHWVFNAIGGTTATGSFSYDGNVSYSGTITSLSVNGHDATFSGVVESSTNPYTPPGYVLTWTVHDVADPGVGHDYFTYAGTDLPTITAGDIQVQA